MDKWFVSRYKRFFEEAKKRLPANCNALIIGANDGVQRDPTHQIWRENWRGLFIEPNPQAKARLIANIGIDPARYIFVPKAVSEQEGFLKLWTMTQEASAIFQKIKGDHGSCLTSTNKEHIVSRVKKVMSSFIQKEGSINNVVIQIEVPCSPLSTILIDNQYLHVNLIQIDTEGMDLIMVQQVCDCIDKQIFSNGMPPLIIYEHKHLSEENQIVAEQLLRKHKYITERMRNDTIAFPDLKKTWSL